MSSVTMCYHSVDFKIYFSHGDQSDNELNPKILNNELEKLEDLQALLPPGIPDIFSDTLDDELEEGGGLTLPATPLETPSDIEVLNFYYLSCVII